MSHKHKHRDKHRNEREVHLERELEFQRQREQELLRELELQAHLHNPEPKRDPVKDDILFVSAPTPITVGLHGRNLTLELPTLRLSSEENLNGRQTGQRLGVLIHLLRLLSSLVSSHCDADPRDMTLDD